MAGTELAPSPPLSGLIVDKRERQTDSSNSINGWSQPGPSTDSGTPQWKGPSSSQLGKTRPLQGEEDGKHVSSDLGDATEASTSRVVEELLPTRSGLNGEDNPKSNTSSAPASPVLALQSEQLVEAIAANSTGGEGSADRSARAGGPSKISSASLRVSPQLSRRTRSSSPFPRYSPSSNGLVALPRSSQGRSSPTPLDMEEEEQLRVRASTSSSTVLPPPPSLPYDLSYPPLSPLGVDQTGHLLSLQLPDQAAKRVAADVANVNGIQNGDQSGRVAGRTTGGRNLPQDRPRKALSGQEMEQHLVSEAPDQHPMPWGLQSTLIDKASGLPLGRTRMGTLKRNAPRSLRMRGSNKAMQSDMPTQIKLEDEGASELDSPQLPVLEVQDDGGEVGHGSRVSEAARDANAQTSNSIRADTGEDDPAMPDAALHDTPMVDSRGQSVADDLAPLSSQGEALSAGGASETDDGRGLTRQSFSPSTSQFGLDDSKPVTLNSDNAGAEPMPLSIQKQSTPTGRVQRRGREIASLMGDALIETQEEEGDVSTESMHSRRPREAHKRLKMQGGYYGRLRKSVADWEASAAIKSEDGSAPPEQSRWDSAEPATGASRGASSTIERQNAVEEITEAIAANPSTPIKSSQQPSMSITLRNSASKSQSSRLIHAGPSTGIDDGEGNNEFCETCNGVGHFICCDGCPRSFHFACINPPMDIDELPTTVGDSEDKWFCNACKAQRGRKQGRAKAPKGIFRPLLQFIEDENPTIFSLPQDIRNYFKGVATASDGSYVDSTMLRPLKINKFGLVDERDPVRLKDKNGKLILCYRCGESALPPDQSRDKGDKLKARRSSPRKSQSTNSTVHSDVASTAQDAKRTGWRKIIGCDFCSLHWHLDCLDPPLATMPSLSRKWMCPNHIDHVIRPERIPKSVANSTSIHDLPLPTDKSVGPGKHYRTRVLNDGRIDIIPDPMDTYFGAATSLTSTRSQKEDLRVPSLALSVSGPGENRGRGLEKGWEEQDIPTSLPGYKSGNSSQNLKFKYRLPEKVIRLDFWSRAELEREQLLLRLIQKSSDRARSRLDLLATIADAALSAATYDTGSTGVGDNLPISEEEAKNLTEQLFGAQAVRPLFPVPGLRTEQSDNALSDDHAHESALRQTYQEGVYEQEFDERSASMVSPSNAKALAFSAEATAAMAAQSEDEKLRQENVNEATASLLQIGSEEVKKLRAVKTLLERRGAKDLLEFLIDQGK